MDSARESRTERVPEAFPIYPRVLKDIPRFAAITLVAPGERFNALAIFLTPVCPAPLFSTFEWLPLTTHDELLFS